MKKLFSIMLVLMLLCGGALAQEKDIVVLYTNDVHCGVDAGIGYAGIASYRDKMLAEGNYVTLVDCGDAVQGEAIGTLSKGAYIIDIMNELKYDIAIPGNHEFDYGMQRFFELVEQADFPYVSCNFVSLADDKPIFDAYEIIDYDGVKVAYLGICTPKTLTSSSPSNFQNESGDYIYGFCQDDDGSKLYGVVQSAVDAARAEGADYVIALAHLGIEESCVPWTSSEVIVNTTGIDVMLDAHAHVVMPCEEVKNKDGKTVLLTSTGTKLANLGVLRIGADGKLSTSLLAFNTAIDDFIKGKQAEFAEVLNAVVAKTEVDLVINEPGSDPPVRIVRNAETNLGDLCADAYRAVSGADIAFINGGGIRVGIDAGDITYGDIISVHPFGNEMGVMEVTGQAILDALEMGANVVPSQNGSFLHVSGLTYEIHTYIESSVNMDANDAFQGVEGEYRVKNVMVGGEPLELDELYTLASINFILDGGSFTMFKDVPYIVEGAMLDNQVLISYITDVLGGVVGEQYADPYGEGRIVAVAEKPAE